MRLPGRAAWAVDRAVGDAPGSVRGGQGAVIMDNKMAVFGGGQGAVIMDNKMALFGVGAAWARCGSKSVPGRVLNAREPGHPDTGEIAARAAVFALLCSGTGQEQLKTRSLEQENEQQQNADVEEQERGIRARRRGACRSGPCRCGHCRRGWGPGWTIAWAGESQRTGRTGLVCVKL